MMNRTIRRVQKEDLAELKEVLDTSELFPSELLDDMISDYLNNKNSTDIWLTTVEDDRPISLAYCRPETFTEGTYNLLAIAVHKKHQGQGVGRALIQYIEQLLREMGHRILIVETSSDPDLELTRQFYVQNQYTKEAVLRDFWKEGEDKVIFWKKLN